MGYNTHISEYKDIIGVVSVGFALTGYALYFRDIFVHHTKPHAFSWLIWGILAGIAFAAQFVGDAGAGSWVTFTDVFLCALIFGIALRRGETQFVPLDWISLILAASALFLWWLTETPTLSVILITMVDFFAFLPTYRKSFAKPWEESVSMYVFSSLKYAAALLALNTYSIATALYVGAIIPMNVALIAIILWRRYCSGSIACVMYGRK